MAADAFPLATRFNLPPSATGEAQGISLEMVHWPLFSCIGTAAGTALPRLTECFNFIPGQNVPGTIAALTATKIHTNMPALRTIGRPSTFLVEGIRVIVPPLALAATVALADGTSGAAVENNDQVDDLTLIYLTMAMKFSIGQKVYAEAPFMMMPANAGIGGVFATDVNANAASIWQARVALHTCGLGYQFKTGRRPLIWNGEPVTCELKCEWLTNPSPTDDHLIYVVLDGIHGRAIQ